MGPLLALAGEFFGPLLAEGSVAVRGLSAELKAADKGLSKLGQQFGVTREEAKSFFDGLGVEDLTNPYKMLGKAVGLVKDLLIDSTAAAMKFNHEFMVLENMNLDKSNRQIEKLNDQILGLSITEGLDPNEAVKSFSTIQRITGKYGDEVGDIVEKITRFSNAVGANNQGMMESIGRGMDAFQLSGGGLDAYLNSQVKTAKLGAVAYDELASAQAQYMDAAVDAGQGYESANKFFTAFNQITHDAQKSATLTQSVFAGFADSGIRDSLSEMGIKFTDVNGQMSESGKVVEQLKNKFKGMGDKEFSTFLDGLGGTDDMNEAFGLIRNKGGKMSASFREFDNSSMNSGDILANADGDASTQLSKVAGQLNGIMTSLGQMFLPAISEALSFISEKLAGTVGLFTALNTEGGFFANVLKYAVSYLEVVFSVGTFFTEIFAKSFARVAEFIGKSELLGDVFGFMSGVFSGVADAIGFLTDVAAFGVERILIPLRLLEGLYRLVKDQFGPKIETFLSHIKDFFGMVSGFVHSIIDGIKEKLMDLADFLGPFADLLGLDMSSTPTVSATDKAKNFLGEEGFMRIANDPAAYKEVMSQFGFKDSEDIYSKTYGNADLANKVKSYVNNFDLLARLNDPKVMKDINKKFGIKDKVGAAALLQGPNAENFKEALAQSGLNQDLGSQVNTINEGGKSVRNVTVTIQKLVETINNNVSGVAEGMRKSEDIVLEGLVRIVNDAEMALANSNTY